MPWVSQTAGTSQLSNPHHHLGASWCGWGEDRRITLHPVGKPSPTQRCVQLLSLLENCSCNYPALQSTLSHGSQDPTECLSVKKVGFLCALVVLLKQSTYPYQKSVSSDAHKAKTSQIKTKTMAPLNCIMLISLYTTLYIQGDEHIYHIYHPLPHADSIPKIVNSYTLQDNQ